MRIAVIGAGGVGGAFGAALAKGGSDVTFLARGAHLKAMRERGLKVLGPRGDIHLHPGILRILRPCNSIPRGTVRLANPWLRVTFHLHTGTKVSSGAVARKPVSIRRLR
jgi:2-polyprenyl-6-methoxyphenol hydroxylase-like FAD-dependent oxidoreductase